MALPAPVTRKDYLLAAAAGMQVNLPEAVTKEDKYLESIAARMDTFLERIAETQILAEGISELNIAIKVVDDLPASGEENTLYLVHTNSSVTGARFAKYTWIDGEWEALSAAEIIRSHLDAYFAEMNREYFRNNYMCTEDYVLVFRGNKFAAVEKAQTSAEYAGQTVKLTIVTRKGPATQSVVIEENGIIPASAFCFLSEGYNIIFCQTDPSLTPVNRLVGPTAIPLRLTFELWRQNPEDGGFLSFLASVNLALDYVALNPRPTSLDGNTTYYVRCYTDNTAVWDALNSSDGYFYNPLASLDDAEDDEEIYIQVYTNLMTLEGPLLVFRSISNPVLRSVKAAASYAGQSAQLTIINSGGEHTAYVTIGADGSIPLASFASIAQGYNLIFCETDPAQKSGNSLTGPTAVPLPLVCESFSAPAAGRFSQFLADNNLRAVYTAVNPRPQESDSNTEYFIGCFTNDTSLWELLDTDDGNYYKQIPSLDSVQSGTTIYRRDIIRTSTG